MTVRERRIGVECRQQSGASTQKKGHSFGNTRELCSCSVLAQRPQRHLSLLHREIHKTPSILPKVQLQAGRVGHFLPYAFVSINSHSLSCAGNSKTTQFQSGGQRPSPYNIPQDYHPRHDQRHSISHHLETLLIPTALLV